MGEKDTSKQEKKPCFKDSFSPHQPLVEKTHFLDENLEEKTLHPSPVLGVEIEEACWLGLKRHACTHVNIHIEQCTCVHVHICFVWLI